MPFCGDGANQSPINIDSNKVATAPGSFSPVTISWANVQHEDLHWRNGSIHVEMSPSNTLAGGPLDHDVSYSLYDFHFHTPSEHSFDGLHGLIEVHFFHASPAGDKYAVVSVRFREGAASPWLQLILDAKGNLTANSSDYITNTFNPTSILPDDLSYLAYQGSATTPPCAENVWWILLVNMPTASAHQISQMMRWEGLNNRPLQLNNQASIYAYSTVYVYEGEKSVDYMLVGFWAVVAVLGFTALVIICFLLCKHYYSVDGKVGPSGEVVDDLEEGARTLPVQPAAAPTKARPRLLPASRRGQAAAQPQKAPLRAIPAKKNATSGTGGALESANAEDEPESLPFLARGGGGSGREDSRDSRDRRPPRPR
eukprot:gnl/Hemi2/4480_TR1571_c0_g1_i1.p1 gnl/Hemi2/4480_TR1571_c0_g1~~gnl/Hemi2/4480_TR1571_c0_g1_i1.p1  ORF type:complete len:369 (+),score=119.22 gnl/Hemi2/4480_TR1571_c0_g1_i1:182-1288(+)